MTQLYNPNSEPEYTEDPWKVRALRALTYADDIDGSHHKQWIIDQMVRALTGPGYDAWVRSYCDGEDGPETYSWDEGIAP